MELEETSDPTQTTQTTQGNQPSLETSSPPVTATIPQQQTTNLTPQVLIPEKRGGLGGIVDEIRNALVPQQSTQIYRDPQTGDRYVQRPYRTPGQQWQKLAGEAIRGAAAGLANGQGPGGPQRAAAAGITAGIQQTQAEKEMQKKQADEDYQIARQNRIDKANTYLQQVQLASQEFALKRMQTKATQDDIEFSQKMNDRESARGSIDLGIYPDHYTLPDVQKNHPEVDFWKQGVSGMIQAHPGVDPETGERKGVHVWLVQPSVLDQAAPQGTQAHRVEYDTNNVPHITTFTPTGNHTLREIQSMDDYAYGVVQKYQAGQAETALRTAQTLEAKSGAAKNYAEARKNQVEAEQAEQGGTVVTPQTAAMLVEGQVAPSQLSKRAKEYNQLLPMANQYSMQHYGTPFDAEVSEGRYKARQKVIESYADGKEADQISSFNTFLGHAENLSNSVNALRNTLSPLINTPYNKLRDMVGDPSVKAILPQIEAVRREYQNFLNNNHALHQDDIAEGKQMIDENASPAQMQAAIRSFAHTALIRVGTLNDRYRRTMGSNVPDLLNEGSVRTLQQFGFGPQANELLRLTPANTNPPKVAPAPPGQVAVQIPGQQAGYIPQSALQQFQKDHPNAQVIQ